MTRSRPLASLIGLSLLAACSGWPGGGDGSRATQVPESAPVAKPGTATAQDCAAPLPGHPTQAEKRDFVADVSRLASEAERRHGVPAAAITAIAIQESGYGWTPLARNSNNLMAWKWTGREAAGGRDFWVLDCPALGSADRFVRFTDRADAVDFVATQLATSDNYRADTERYQRERADGTQAAEAVDRWLDGVADPYSTRPEVWRQAMRRVMNDPLDPSDRRSPDANLYRLSEQAAPSRRSA